METEKVSKKKRILWIKRKENPIVYDYLSSVSLPIWDKPSAIYFAMNECLRDVIFWLFVTQFI